MSDLPTLRWGIIATGMISSWFVEDITRDDWPNKRANHKVVAIGSSSAQKGQDFASKYLPSSAPKPTIYGSYDEVYADPNVDCIYIGTPHSFHRDNCFAAIRAGKHVLCEKPFTMTLAQTNEVFAAAKENGVFVMEAMWTRFFPLVRKLQSLVHDEKVIGDVQRTFCDFALGIGDISALPPTSRYRDVKLGAGSLLDIGIYSLTWGLITLAEGKVGEDAKDPNVVSQQTLSHGVDVASSFVLFYENGKQGVLSSTTDVQAITDDWCRIEGSKGTIVVSGPAPSLPKYFTVKMHGEKGDGKRYDFENPGRGFYWEADAVAHDIKAGKTQDDIMPWKETERVMGILDGIRKRGGAKFAEDDQ
ncbi:hypothetical protein MBLNU457_2178t1 [Dothideomycetes sp. NU457]